MRGAEGTCRYCGHPMEAHHPGTGHCPADWYGLGHPWPEHRRTPKLEPFRSTPEIRAAGRRMGWTVIALDEDDERYEVES